MLGGLELVVDLVVGVEVVHDALVAPEVNGDSFQAGQVRAKFGDRGVLHVAEEIVLGDVALHVGEENAFVARGTGGAVRRRGGRGQ